MAEENKHPPTTEEQTPPEMPGKAPKMEQDRLSYEVQQWKKDSMGTRV